jgi:hypothetical protein
MPYIPAAATAVLEYKNLKLQHLPHLPKYTPHELQHWGTYTDLLTPKKREQNPRQVLRLCHCHEVLSRKRCNRWTAFSPTDIR